MTIIATLAALIAGAVAELWNPPPYRRWPLLTLVVVTLVVAVFAVQGARPEVFGVLDHDPEMISSGEVWRGVTALFVPDGGFVSLLFNIFWLLVLGTLAERRFSRVAWLAIYLFGGTASQFLALAWQADGAGSSVGCFVLAGALCSDWRPGRGRRWRAGVGIAGAVAGFVLLMENDIHGIGFLAGLGIGFVLVANGKAAGGGGLDPPFDPSDSVVYMGRVHRRH
jgi:membrane associated rhomboid family serine protease